MSRRILNTVRATVRRMQSLSMDSWKDEIENRKFGKLLVLGDRKVGKTAIVRLLCIKGASTEYTPTLAVSSYSLKSTFQTEDPDQPSTRNLKKGTVKDGFKKQQTVREVYHCGSEVDANGNTKRQPLSQKQHVKTLELEMIDTPSNFPESTPAEFRALVSEAHGFLLVCDEEKEESIDYIITLLHEIDESLSIPAMLPRIVVIVNHNSSTGVAEEIREAFATFDVTLVELPMNLPNPIQYLLITLFEKLNIYDENEKIEESIPVERSYVEHGKSRKGFSRTISHYF